MCGIVVGLAFGELNKRDEATRQRLLRYFTTELLVRTEERGKDATGAAVLFDNGKYIGLKRGQRAANFLGTFSESKEYYGGFLKFWRESEENMRVYLGHCRAATTGDKDDNENNHPIKVGNLIGIHNGVIKNHDLIFENLGCERDAKVDSEAIFRLFEHYTSGGKEPFTMDMVQSVVKRLSGQFTVSLFNADNPFQVPMFRDGRPAEFILIKKYGLLLAVSEKKFWEEIHFRYERIVSYYNEFSKVKLPSLLGKNAIEEDTLKDDSAVIFDLTVQVDENTKINDLGEWKKMDRTKLWGTATTPAHENTYGAGYNHSTRNKTNSFAKDKDSTGTGSDKNSKKRRVFDSIKKAYVIKIGDKVLDDEASVVMPVNSKAGKDSGTEAVISSEKNETTKIDGGLSSSRKDTGTQTTSDAQSKLEDHTDYSSQSSVDNRPTLLLPESKLENVTDADPTDMDIKGAGGSIVEVEMEKYPPAVVEASNTQYDALKDKGYGNIEELINAVDIATKEKAEDVGIVVIANRAYKSNWKSGFMAGAAWATADSAKDKNEKREKHIAGLKSLVLTLSGFFNKSQTKNECYNTTVAQRLRTAALSLGRGIDIESLNSIFNTHERGQIKEVGKIISEATRYKD